MIIRQATYSTNSANKNKQYSGAKIIAKFEEWKRAKLCKLEYQNISHRCVQPIFDFADRLHPALPKPVAFSNYLDAKVNWHLWGIAGGIVWDSGLQFNLVALRAQLVGPAVSYALGQGATMISAA